MLYLCGHVKYVLILFGTKIVLYLSVYINKKLDTNNIYYTNKNNDDFVSNFKSQERQNGFVLA